MKLGYVIGGFIAWAMSTSALAQKPNVLFISIDDMRPQLGAYGHELMVTPNLDQLATESRLFTRHYAQVPTCGPSRACLLTGRNVQTKAQISHHHLRHTLAGTTEPDSPETFAHHFKRNGYYTVGMGKISHADGGYYYDKKTKTGELELPHSWNEYLKVPPSQWDRQGLLHAFAYGKTRSRAQMPPFECFDLNDEDYPDGRLANVAVEKLAALAKQNQPFLMAVGFFKPHLPFCAPKKYWDMYDRADISVSPNPDLPNAVDPVFVHESREFFGQYSGGREIGGAGKRLSDDYAREVRHGYYASVTYADAQVGKVLVRLKELGLDKNTIVVVWGDHGWHLGDHTIWGKHSTFERALNSLLMVKVPNMTEPGVPSDGLAASIDLYPTLCDLAKLSRPAELDGASLVPLLNDPTTHGRQAVVSYWRDILSIRTDRHRMSLYHDGKQQKVMLFDHETDPNESQNVASEHPKVVAQLTGLISKHNRGFLPELEQK